MAVGTVDLFAFIGWGRDEEDKCAVGADHAYHDVGGFGSSPAGSWLRRCGRAPISTDRQEAASETQNSRMGTAAEQSAQAPVNASVVGFQHRSSGWR